MQPILSHLNEVSRRYDQDGHQLDYRYVIDSICYDEVKTMVFLAPIISCLVVVNIPLNIGGTKKWIFLEEASIRYNLICEAAGKAEHGPVFS